MSGPWKDTRTWGDVAGDRNGDDISDYRGGNPAWRDPKYQKDDPYAAPGHTRMFSGDRQWGGDKPGRSFEARKQHGWWGKTEYFDESGRKIG